MQIMIDTREKQHAIKRILSEFEKHGMRSMYLKRTCLKLLRLLMKKDFQGI